MEIRWLGHSAFEIISDDNVKILIDPFISNNPTCQIPIEELNPNPSISDCSLKYQSFFTLPAL